MATNYLKPFRLSSKIIDGKPRHLFIKQLKDLMDSDSSLHPMMDKTLKMLKKTRSQFIMLATIREVVFDPLEKRHFDRSAEPRGDWTCTLWSNEEIEQHEKDPKGHIKASLKLFEGLGYEMFDSSEVSIDYLDNLAKLTENQIMAQLKGREMQK